MESSVNIDSITGHCYLENNPQQANKRVLEENILNEQEWE
jgi:hypothetical protein